MTESQHLVIDDELIEHLATEDGAMEVFRSRLSPEVLTEDGNYQEVARFTQDYISKYNKTPGPVVLQEEFGLSFDEPHSDVRWVIQELRKRHMVNQMSDMLLTAAGSVQHEPEETADILLGQVTRLKQEVRTQDDSLSHHDWMNVYADYQERCQRGMFKGLTFGFEEIDEVLGGMRPETLTYVIGRPKRYKSWFLLKAALENFLKGKNVTVWSLELDRFQMYWRFMCMMASVSWVRFQMQGLNPDEHERIKETVKIVENSGRLHIRAPRGGCTVPEIRQQSREDEADFVVIDQLSWLRHTEKIRSDLRHREVEYINYDLKEATDDFPIYIAAQFNREADSVDEMADLSKIGLSDSIGQIADMVMGLYRNKEMAKNNLIEFGTIESRGFENARFEIKVNLSSESNFDLIARTDAT